MTISQGVNAIRKLSFATAGTFVVLAGLASPDSAAAQQCIVTATFSTTGPQVFVVPIGVTTISVDAFGAQGGSLPSAAFPGVGGQGGRATIASMPVTPGESLQVQVGGQGTSVPGPINSTPSPVRPVDTPTAVMAAPASPAAVADKAPRILARAAAAHRWSRAVRRD
ncbi:MAG: hypothetical protein IT178_05660 [Acidobacteria bacterium]|nr:hypothetical protein [Acidobacteriota bacterium]